MKQEVLIGQTDYTVLVKMRDTAGAAKTALTEASIDIAYARVETDNDVTTTDVTPAALSALTDAHTDWGFEEVSATDHPGLYRLDIADAVFASGAWSAVVTVTGTGLDPADMEFVLVPSAPLAGVLLAPTTHTSAVIPTVTTTGTATAVTTVNGLAANVITAASIAAGAIDAATFAADVDAEILSYIVDDATRIDASALNTAAVTSVPAILADTGTDGVAIADNYITAAKIADGAIDAATFAASAITSTVLANDAITAAKLHADVTTELQSGLATAAALDAVDNFIDTEITTLTAMLTGIVPVNGTIGATGNDTTHLHLSGLAYADDGPNSMLILVKDVSAGIFVSRWIEDFANTGDLATVATLPFTPEASVDTYWILPVRADVTGGSGLDAAGVRAAVGLASANLDTQLGTIDDFLDTEVAAIKAKTDNLPSDPADASDIASSFTTVNTKLDTIDDFLDTEVAAIKAKTDNLPAAPAATGDIPTAAAIADAVLDEDMTAHQTQGTFGQAIGDPAADTDSIWALVNTNLNATTSSRASQVSLDIIGTYLGVDITDMLTVIDNFLDTEVAAIKAKTDNLPSDPADQSAIEAAILTAWTTALTESYRGAGATGTPAQLLYEIIAHLGESSIATTTKTLKKLDGSTTAKTYTLNSATTPTAITETT
jgi:hypothetical protein